jgi:cytochrome P450
MMMMMMIKGGTFLVWFGPTVRLTVSDPDLIREIFTSKSEFYEKNEAPPLVKQLEGDGLLSLKGEKWAHHRRIISPTFHMENLKVCNYLHFLYFFKNRLHMVQYYLTIFIYLIN